MNTALALAQIIVPLLPTIAGDISQLVAWLTTVRAAGRQTGEWTEEMDTDFRKAIVASGRDPAYLPDPK